MAFSFDYLLLVALIVVASVAGLWIGKAGAYIAAAVGVSLERITALIQSAAQSIGELHTSAAAGAGQVSVQLAAGELDDWIAALLAGLLAGLIGHVITAALHILAIRQAKAREALIIRGRRW